MSLSSIARTKKRTGELSFATKSALYRDSIGEESFKEQHESLTNLGRMLYNQLRIDGVLPKRAKAWEKLDEQDQLKWGASANDVAAMIELVKENGAKSGLMDTVGGLVSKFMGPSKATPVDPNLVRVLFGADGIDPREALADESEPVAG